MMGRLGMRLLTVTFLILFGVLARPQASLACTCTGEGPERVSEHADVVFHGRAVRVQRFPWSLWEDGHRTRVLFLADRVWKGRVQWLYVVEGGSFTASCEMPFERGRRYLVSADYGRGETLGTNMCRVFTGDGDGLGSGTSAVGIVPVFLGFLSASVALLPLTFSVAAFVGATVFVVRRLRGGTHRSGGPDLGEPSPTPQT